MKQTITTMPSIRCQVSGRVQGVFYRAATQRKAQALGLTGWVRNLPDGRVELVASGRQESLLELQDWLWEGPPNAAVLDVRCEHIEHPAMENFEVW